MSLIRKKPDISVVLPIYNIEENYLRACLDSIVNQTKDNLEVILIDDGSTNNCGEVCDEYVNKYDYFNCWHIENQGVGHARNYGIEQARGKYIAFVDPDDILAPDIYEKLFLAAKRNNSDLAITNAIRFNSKNTYVSNIHLMAFKDLESVTHITKSPALIYDTSIWNKLIRRRLLKKHRISYPEDIWYEDIPFATKVHYYANSVSVIRETGYRWRIREAGEKSITQHAKSLKNLRDRIECLKILDDFIENTVRDEEIYYQKNIKALTADFMIFINYCLEIDKSQAQDMMKLIKEYVLTLTTTRAFESLNTFEKAIYQAIFDDDYDRFIKIASFRKNNFPNLPYFEKDGRVFAKLPEELFDEEFADITNLVSRGVPTFYINNVKIEGDKATFRTTLYQSRIETKDKSEQQVKIFLVNEMTGEEKPLKVKSYKNHAATKARGHWVCRDNGEETCYNYDGTGYSFVLDKNELRPENVKNLVIIAKYKTRYIKGIAAINDLTKYAI